MKKNPVTINALFALADNVFNDFLLAHTNELGSRKGGKLLAIPKSLIVEGANIAEIVGRSAVKQLGDLPTEKRSEKETFARNKGKYLATELLAGNSLAISSYLGWDEENGVFGGGILTDDYILTFSGFPPHLDQKFCIALALIVNQLTLQSATEIHLNTLELQTRYMAA